MNILAMLLNARASKRNFSMKAIYFDTNVFYHCKFNVDDDCLARIIELAKELNVELWTSEIAKNEIYSGISRKISDLKTAYDKTKHMLHNCFDDRDILDESMLAEAETLIIADFDGFFRDNNFISLNYDVFDDSDVSKIFNDYFTKQGCFSSKKKSEFPDAFQIELIKRHTICNDNIAIVSQDEDFEKAFSLNNEISIYKSIQQLQKQLESVSPSNSKAALPYNKLESRILYYLDDFETEHNLYSELSFNDTSISRTDINETLKSLINKNSISQFVYNTESSDFVITHSTEPKNEKVWFKVSI